MKQLLKIIKWCYVKIGGKLKNNVTEDPKEYEKGLVFELFDMGHSYRAISEIMEAEGLKVSKSTVGNWIKKRKK